jgi:outer membrane lipase/esterase
MACAIACNAPQRHEAAAAGSHLEQRMSLGSLGFRRAARLVSWLALGLLASCGGSTQVERFVPTRVLAFGDESSVIEADGRKYTVNALKADLVTPECAANLLWVQIVAGHYGLVFPQCAGSAVAPASRILAAKDARVADLAAQITQAGAMSASDLATVFIGSNDIIALYGLYPARSQDALVADAEAQAVVLARQIRSIVDKGAKVAFATLPDLGGSPFALAEEAKFPGTGRAAVLSALTTRFNSKLRTSISNGNSGSFVDGHQGAQVLADELMLSIRKTVDTAPSSATYLNYATAVCDPALDGTTQCSTETLLPAAKAAGGNAFNYLWADSRRLSAGGHSSLGSLAVTRINANPL